MLSSAGHLRAVLHGFKLRGTLAFVACSALLGVAPAAQAAVDPHLFVVTADLMRGSSTAIRLESPWVATRDVEPVGTLPIVRHFFGRHYVVDSASGMIQVIDPETFDTITTFSVGPFSRPQDILLIDPQTAYVSRYDDTLLYKVNPETGELLNTIDLAIFADADRLPEMSMMTLDRNHLFIQIQRMDRLSGNPVRPSYLAVVDVNTDTLVVTNPLAGPPGIALEATIPSLKMHRDSRARRLFVRAAGVRLDVSGGIEEIDLDALTSLGIFLSEAESIGDLGPFVMVSPDRGYAVGHTDITPSSHLFEFTRTGGRVTNELHLTFVEIESLAYDPATSQLYFPDSDTTVLGIHVFDTRTNERLTRKPILTGLPPRDLIVVRPATLGAATELRVSGIDPLTGDLSISYRPACGASDHNIVWGPLQDVANYTYSGQDCSIGTSGSYDQFNPGAGSFFFVVVGTDPAGTEGSYGLDSAGLEHPEDLLDPLCLFNQDLSFSCDVW